MHHGRERLLVPGPQPSEQVALVEARRISHVATLSQGLQAFLVGSRTMRASSLLSSARRRARTTITSELPRRTIAYSPRLDGDADPGEVVWTWVAYEEDDGRGKDRPVLVVGREGRSLLGLMLSSNPARDDQRGWLALGTGAWDHQHRPSWVRLDRVLTVGAKRVRREGAVLDRARFERVARELRARYGWK